MKFLIISILVLTLANEPGMAVTCKEEVRNILAAIDARINLNMISGPRYRNSAIRSVESTVRAQVESILAQSNNPSEAQLALIEDYVAFARERQLATPEFLLRAEDYAITQRFRSMNESELANYFYEHFNNLPNGRVIIHQSVREELEDFPASALRNLYRTLTNLNTGNGRVDIVQLTDEVSQIRVARNSSVGALRVYLVRNAQGEYLILRAYVKKINGSVGHDFLRNVSNRQYTLRRN